MGGQQRWDTHWDAGHNWALVLAAGEGSRLQSLTTTASGVAVPKQFCSMGNDDSLLVAALRRAHEVAPAERTCAIFAEHHRRWWQPLSLGIPPENVIAQPRSRGTATGILLPLLQIVRRDPEATLLVLPSDHYVRNEAVLASSLRNAMSTAEREPDRIILLGITPEEADAELGYVVADGIDSSDVRAVTEFVEKPSAAEARKLLARGAVWNSFIFAARAQALLRVFEARCPEVVSQMRRIVAEPSPSLRTQIFESLPRLDFSRDILQGSLPSLSVVAVPPCGWSDMGTPVRVQQTFKRYGFASNACRVPT